MLLYELLTGTTPLTREMLRQGAFEEVLRRIREQEPPIPSLRLSTSRERRPTISAQRKLEPEKLPKVVRGELDWIVMKALEKDRNHRYETASGFALDLQHYLNDEAVAAGPPTARYRVKKFVRKHRQAVAVAAAFVVLLTAAAVLSTGLALWANRERLGAVQAQMAEGKAREDTQQQYRRAEAALTEMQIQRAEDFFAADDSARALAQLASVLSRDPSNRVAAERLLSALTFRNYGLPLTEPLRHADGVRSAQFSPDGLWVVTSSYDKAARVWDALTGKPLTEPLRHESQVSNAEFSPDGLRVVTASDDKTARVWEVPFGPVPAPSWLPRLAEIVASSKVSGPAVLEPVANAEFLKLKEQLMQSAETNYYARWAKWFCSDRSTRTLSPLSSISVPEYIQRRIEENTLESLQEAVSLAPTNGLAFARLAR